MKLKDKVALVTGAAQGIGWGVCQRFYREGASLVLVDVEEELLKQRVQQLGSRATYVVGDVTKEEEVERMFQHTLEKFSKLHILVTCAGILRPAMLHKMELRQWKEVLEVHLTGSFLCVRAAAKHWIQEGKKEGRKIVLVSSIAGLRGTIGQVNYATSKAGILGLTMASARELGKYGINVNAVAFGIVETQMTEKIRKDEKLRNFYLQQIVLGRFASVEEVTPAVLFLASSDSDYITGQVLCVDGGIHIGL